MTGFVAENIVLDHVAHWGARVAGRIKNVHEFGVGSAVRRLRVVQSQKGRVEASCAHRCTAVGVARHALPVKPAVVKRNVLVVVDECVGVDAIVAPSAQQDSRRAVLDNIAIKLPGRGRCSGRDGKGKGGRNPLGRCRRKRLCSAALEIMKLLTSQPDIWSSR